MSRRLVACAAAGTMIDVIGIDAKTVRSTERSR
jgi:hypothetical protein